MDVSFSQALNAYQKRLLNESEDSGGDALANGIGGTPGTSFGDILSDALDSVVSAQEKAETLKAESISGKVELSELVTSIAEAELALNTVVAVRDRVISAYQEITRMPI